MARGIEGNEIGTQKKKAATPSTQKPAPKQQSIAGFFQKRLVPTAITSVTPAKRSSDAGQAEDASRAPRSSADITPVASSPPTVTITSQQSSVDDGRDKENGRKSWRYYGVVWS
jgi:DNA mismatch repair protein MSH6